MKYRKDIDGLRSIAVLPVILYHAGMSVFSGGYVGVDIFFVISGFLITGIIYNDMNNGVFSVAAFYVRRIKRIFPALFFMLTASAVLSAAFLLPEHLRNFGKSLIAAVFFSSNFFFWKQSGYFDTTVEEKPLLHTWSLGVEEQFYIFFPLFLYFLYKNRKNTRMNILAVFAVSFFISVFCTAKYPEASFYLLPARAWELMLGSMAALGMYPKTDNKLYLNSMSLSGLAMIAFSVFFYTDTTLFPGYAAFLPCFGALLIIIAGCQGETVVGRLLGLKPFVFVGLLSYSLYLWHWPFFAMRNYYGHLISGWFVLSDWFIIGLTFLFAAFSYYTVEHPFRVMKVKNRPRLFRNSAYVMSVFTAIGCYMYFSDGMPYRVPDSVNRMTYVEKSDYRNLTCFKGDPETAKFDKLCKIGDGKVRPSFLLWGDSHALSLTDGLNDIAKTAGYAGVFAGKSTCPPFRLVQITNMGVPSNCRQFNDNVFNGIINNKDIKNVILAGRWGSYTDDSDEPAVLLVDVSKKGLRYKSTKVFEDGLTRTVRSLEKAGKKVYIAADIPDTPFDSSSELGKQEYLKSLFPSKAEQAQASISYDYYMKRNAKAFEVIRSVMDKTELKLINVQDALCRGGKCVLSDGERALYSDDNHLSKYGSEFLVKHFAGVFNGYLAK